MTESAARRVFRALRHRNYRLFFAGQGISLVGTWMQSVAVSWLVYRLTDSAFLLGLVAFCSQLPPLFLSPLAGVLSDRVNRRRILMLVQSAAMVQALVLAAVTLTGIVALWQIIVLGFLLGIVNAFEMPTRQSFVLQMVESREDLANAIALNSSLFNASRLLGPAVAGVMIGLAGEGLCFVVNGLSYMAAFAALAAMRLAPSAPPGDRRRLFAELSEGLRYVGAMPPIRDLLFFIAILSFVGMSLPVVLPVFATRVLMGDSHTFGFLVSASGIGALAGTIFLAFRKSVLGLGRVIAVSMALFGASLAAFSFSTLLPLSLALLVCAGFGLIVSMASGNTILQTIVDDDKRGRVMSFYVMAVVGTAPLGSLATGGFSAVAGVQTTALVGGAICLVCALFFFRRLPRFREHVRPIYRRMGIIPEVAMGIQSATDLQEPPD